MSEIYIGEREIEHTNFYQAIGDGGMVPSSTKGIEDHIG